MSNRYDPEDEDEVQIGNGAFVVLMVFIIILIVVLIALIGAVAPAIQ